MSENEKRMIRDEPARRHPVARADPSSILARIEVLFLSHWYSKKMLRRSVAREFFFGHLCSSDFRASVAVVVCRHFFLDITFY